jgi:hypothetical protein
MLDLTDNETCDRYVFDARWRQPLNLPALEASDQTISLRTLWGFSKKLEDSGLFKEILDSVNVNLAKSGNIDLSKQRMDSVHVTSNMAKLSRIQLFSKTITGFLRVLEQKHKNGFFQLVDAPVISSYLSDDDQDPDSSYRFFGDVKAGERDKTLKAMAQDVYYLISLFRENATVSKCKASNCSTDSSWISVK